MLRYGEGSLRRREDETRLAALRQHLLAAGDDSRDLRLARVELEVLLVRYGEAHPQVAAARARIAELAAAP